MLFQKSLAAVAASLLLASCGGGSESESVSTAATPEAAVSALRAQARALRATPGVTAEQAAEQLMDAAERAYANSYFPGHKATARLDAFAYRYYPETGIYLGVVVAAGGYPLEGVYVMGGPFGGSAEMRPTYAGQLTQYITPTPPASSGTGNGCFDLALTDTEGTRLSVGYTYSGPMTGSVTLETTVGGLVTFEGRTVRETSTAMSGSTSFQGGASTSMNSTGKTYAVRNGSELTEYGMLTTSGTSTYRAVYTPPYVNRQNALAVGESFTAQLATTTSYTGGSYSSSETRTTRYVGQESITVPAGTYNACKFETISATSGTSYTYTNWFMVGKGIHLRSVTSDGTKSEANAISLNGARL